MSKTAKITAAIVCLALFAIVWVFVIWPNRSVTVQNERHAKKHLQQLHKAQIAFQKSAALDSDENGTGEFGYLTNLKDAGLLKDSGLTFEPSGNVGANGYYFSVFLPGFHDNENLASSEEEFVILARPKKFDHSGRRCFVITKDQKIYAHNNDQSLPWEGWTSKPSPGDVFAKPFDSSTLLPEWKLEE